MSDDDQHDVEFQQQMADLVSSYFQVEGELAGAWVVICQGFGVDGKHTYKMEFPDDQGVLQTSSLLTYAKAINRLMLDSLITGTAKEDEE